MYPFVKELQAGSLYSLVMCPCMDGTFWSLILSSNYLSLAHHSKNPEAVHNKYLFSPCVSDITW